MHERKQQAHWLAVLAAAAVALYGCWLLFRPFLGVFTWAVVLAITFHPLHRFLRTWTGRPSLSALLATALVVVAVLLPITAAVLAVGHELPGLLREGQVAFARLLGPDSPAGGLLQWLDGYVDVDRLRSTQIFTSVVENGDGLALAGQAFGLVGGLVAVAVQALFVVFALYYLFRDGDQLVAWLPRVLPLEEAHTRELLRRVREMIDASVYGVIVLAVLQGTLGGLAFWVLGLPSPVVWGVVMVLLSIIPVTGSFLVWVPAAVYLAVSGAWVKALLLTAWGVLVIGMIDNFLRPAVMGQKVRMHELLLFFAVLGGLVVFGVPGVVLGPVLVAVALGLLDVIRQTGRPPEAIKREPSLAEQTARIGDGANGSQPGSPQLVPGR